MTLFRRLIFIIASILIYLAVAQLCREFQYLVMFNIAYLTGGFTGILWWIILEYD